MAELQDAISRILCQHRDAAATRADVLDMRRLMLKEQGSGGAWDIKRVRGGLVELEFVAQTLQLIHAHRHPGVLDTNTLAALGKLAAAGVLPAGDGEVLRRACLLYQRLTQVLRLCVSTAFAPATATAGLNRIVASAAGSPDIATAEALLADTEAQVAEVFDRLVGPAG